MKTSTPPSYPHGIFLRELNLPFSFLKRVWLSRFNRSDRRPRRASVALSLEPLEERWLPNATVITVTTAADDPTTPIANQTTLRDAINQANQTTGTTIEFAPSLNGQTLQPLAAFPLLKGAGTTIDGMGLNIALDGSKVDYLHYPTPIAPGDGLDVAASNVTIEGMIIEKWAGSGIGVLGGSWYFGNTNVSNTIISNNIIVNNGSGGVIIDAASAPGVAIASNVNVLGNTISGNGGDGVHIIGSQNEVIGNDISGNKGYGVEVYAGSQNTIQGNLIVGNGQGNDSGGTANNSGSTPAPSPPEPPTSPPSFVQAAIMLFIDGAEMFVNQLEGYNNPNFAAVNADIALNRLYAGPFANWFLLAGEAAAAEQLAVAEQL